MNNNKLSHLASIMGLCLLAAGCATSGSNPDDPLEGWNRGTQTFNDKVDEYALKPVAQGYQWIAPSFVDRGVTNFFSNINDIGVTINDLMQFKLQQGGLDATRFVINSTIGIVGLFDFASDLEFPKHNEDFGQTLGAWGVPSGPYLVLPFIGPSSPRGTVGLVGDAAMNPVSYIGTNAIRFGLSGVNLIDQRADLLKASRVAEQAATDRYEFFRNAYLQRREFLIYDGDPPIDDEDEFEFEDEEFEDEDE